MFDLVDGFGEIFFGVAFRHIEKLTLDTRLGEHDLHLFLEVFEKEVFQKLLFAILRRDDLLGNLMRGIILNDKRRQCVRFGKRSVFERKIAATLHDAAARDQNIDRRIEVIRL